jgi:CO/xanthine dehydrogenase Mo-binding subunit
MTNWVQRARTPVCWWFVQAPSRTVTFSLYCIIRVQEANFGITAALYGEITIKAGSVEQSNFDTYKSLRIDEAPRTEVHLVDSPETPGGIGELSTAAIAPALVNAIFAATGKRLRKLPVYAAQLKI